MTSIFFQIPDLYRHHDMQNSITMKNTTQSHAVTVLISKNWTPINTGRTKQKKDTRVIALIMKRVSPAPLSAPLNTM